MTRRVVVVPPELPLPMCWQIMQRQRFRHLPIVRGDDVMGLISDRDILLLATRSQEGEIEIPNVPAADAMSLALHRCLPSTHVTDVVRMMTDKTIDAVVVMDEADCLVGLVTSTDLLLLLIELEEAKVPIPFDFEVETSSATP